MTIIKRGLEHQYQKEMSSGAVKCKRVEEVPAVHIHQTADLAGVETDVLVLVYDLQLLSTCRVQKSEYNFFKVLYLNSRKSGLAKSRSGFSQLWAVSCHYLAQGTGPFHHHFITVVFLCQEEQRSEQQGSLAINQGVGTNFVWRK